jgi:hypothetical protein
MISAEREQIRLSLLRHCLTPCVLSLLHSFLVAEGFRLSRPEVELELIYLVDKELLIRLAPLISPELPRYRTSADGRDYLATEAQD